MQNIQILQKEDMKKAILVSTRPMDVYEQMACDEVMCETMPEKYILRFFNWKKPGITFGFAQRYKNIIETLNERQKSFDITRRPTGGGVVIHETDITFSFIFYSPEEFNPKKTYEIIHSAIFEEYIENGINIDIANISNSNYNINNPIMECFRKPVDMDLLYNGKKVLGGAIRKFSDYILYQASLQFENARNEFKKHSEIIMRGISKRFNLNFYNFELNDIYYTLVNTKKQEKYIDKNWIERI
jgi:lipoate-protein ligase A